MKFNRISAYLSQSDIAGSLIYCRMLTSGLVLVRGLAPTSRTLEQKLESIVASYAPRSFADWEREYLPRIRIIPSHARDVAKVLARVN